MASERTASTIRRSFLTFVRRSATGYKRRRGRYNAASEPDDCFNSQVPGSNAIDVIEKALGQTLGDVKFIHSGNIWVNGREALDLRQCMAGEVSYEL